MAAVASPIQRGIQLSKVSPAFLHANSTSHTWAFSAFAELIDNAYDPDVSASELLIDKLEINGHTCLIFLDNGAGMDTDKLLKMLSFGFCDKQIYERTLSHLPIGHYGNGFKSGSMRIGKDALVFTRSANSASIGFLSQSYLKAINADSVFIPIVTYRLPKLERIKSEQSRNNLNAILKHSVFRSEQDLKEELFALEGSMTGTKIILSNLKRLQDGTLELDFSSDETDIRCPEAHEVDLTSVYHRPVQLPTSEYKHSLREYCSILFLRPRMKITIRGLRVKSRLISKSLSGTEHDSYKPTWLDRPLKITFGFTCQKTKTEDYGMMLYHRNRLIKAFEKVGYQKQPNDLGIGVVGVAQVDFLQPTHNKQDFNKDEKFNSVMMAFANKLNDYWNEKKEGTPTSFAQDSLRADWTWAQCEMCLKWRRLPDGINKDSLPDKWYCRNNPDATHNRCDIPEEPEDEDLAVKPTYVKTYKKKREEKKRLEMINRQRQQMQPLMQAVPAVNNLQKALAEAKQREEEHRLLILKMEEERKHMQAQLAESLKRKTRGRHEQFVPLVAENFTQQNLVAQLNKRKGDNSPVDSPRNTKMLRTEHHLLNKVKPNSAPDSPGPSSSLRNNSSPSPLKVKVGDLLSKSSKRDNSSKMSSKAGSFNSKKNETFVDLTEDMDYEITLNEDYISDEDVKPDIDGLKSKRKEKEKDSKKGKKEEEPADVKPDKHILDRIQKGKSPVVNKEPTTADDSALLDIKKETTVTEERKELSGGNPLAAAAADKNKSAKGDAPCQNPAEDEDMSDHRVSSNVNKVMAVLENKLKKSLSSENNLATDNNGGKQCDSGKEKPTGGDDCNSKESSHSGSVTDKPFEESDKDNDVIEICSDDDEDDAEFSGLYYSGVSVKKEVEDQVVDKAGENEGNITMDAGCENDLQAGSSNSREVGVSAGENEANKTVAVDCGEAMQSGDSGEGDGVTDAVAPSHKETEAIQSGEGDGVTDAVAPLHKETEAIQSGEGDGVTDVVAPLHKETEAIQSGEGDGVTDVVAPSHKETEAIQSGEGDGVTDVVAPSHKETEAIQSGEDVTDADEAIQSGDSGEGDGITDADKAIQSGEGGGVTDVDEAMEAIESGEGGGVTGADTQPYEAMEAQSASNVKDGEENKSEGNEAATDAVFDMTDPMDQGEDEESQIFLLSLSNESYSDVDGSADISKHSDVDGCADISKHSDVDDCAHNSKPCSPTKKTDEADDGNETDVADNGDGDSTSVSVKSPKESSVDSGKIVVETGKGCSGAKDDSDSEISKTIEEDAEMPVAAAVAEMLENYVGDEAEQKGTSDEKSHSKVDAEDSTDEVCGDDKMEQDGSGRMGGEGVGHVEKLDNVKKELQSESLLEEQDAPDEGNKTDGKESEVLDRNTGNNVLRKTCISNSDREVVRSRGIDMNVSNNDSSKSANSSTADVEENEENDACDDSDDDWHDNETLSKGKTQEEKSSVSSGEKCMDDEGGENSPYGRSDDAGDNADMVSKRRFDNFLNSVHHLLTLLCPEADLGNVSDIEQTVQTMIQIHQEGSQSQAVEPDAT